jgi:hypothetical protein
MRGFTVRFDFGRVCTKLNTQLEHGIGAGMRTITESPKTTCGYAVVLRGSESAYGMPARFLMTVVPSIYLISDSVICNRCWHD